MFARAERRQTNLIQVSDKFRMEAIKDRLIEWLENGTFQPLEYLHHDTQHEHEQDIQERGLRFYSKLTLSSSAATDNQHEHKMGAVHELSIPAICLCATTQPRELIPEATYGTKRCFIPTRTIVNPLNLHFYFADTWFHQTSSSKINHYALLVAVDITKFPIIGDYLPSAGDAFIRHDSRRKQWQILEKNHFHLEILYLGIDEKSFFKVENKMMMNLPHHLAGSIAAAHTARTRPDNCCIEEVRHVPIPDEDLDNSGNGVDGSSSSTINDLYARIMRRKTAMHGQHGHGAHGHGGGHGHGGYGGGNGGGHGGVSRSRSHSSDHDDLMVNNNNTHK